MNKYYLSLEAILSDLNNKTETISHLLRYSINEAEELKNDAPIRKEDLWKLYKASMNMSKNNDIISDYLNSIDDEIVPEIEDLLNDMKEIQEERQEEPIRKRDLSSEDLKKHIENLNEIISYLQDKTNAPTGIIDRLILLQWEMNDYSFILRKEIVNEKE